MINIDAEKAEIGILSGGLNISKQVRPHILLSVYPRHIALLVRSLEDLRLLNEQMEYERVTIEGEPPVNLARHKYMLRPMEDA